MEICFVSRRLDIHIGDVFNTWEVMRAPEKVNNSKMNYCWCKCTCCGKEKHVRCSDLKALASSCICQRKKKYNITKPQKLKTISFQQWCEENQHTEFLDRWDYELNKYTPDVVAYKSGYKIYFKCPRGKHESKGIVLFSITKGGNSCECDDCRLEKDSFGVWCENNKPEILDLWDYDKNSISPYKISYGSNSKYYFKCPRGIHDSSLIKINTITLKNLKIFCYKCNSIGQYIVDNYGEEYVSLFWDYDKNIKDPFSVSRGGSSSKMFIKCLDNTSHPSYAVSPSNFLKGRRCPCCKQERTSSKLQDKIVKYIDEKYCYKMLHEYMCSIKPKNPKTGYALPYDNQVIIDENTSLIIECHGEQHFKVTGYIKSEAEKYGITPEKVIAEIQWRDEYKKQFALSHGYYYLAIPYTAENDESYKSMIDTKIHEILSLNNLKQLPPEKEELINEEYAQSS